MQARKESFDDAKQFFVEFLKIFNCRKIKIEQITIKKRGQACEVALLIYFSTQIRKPDPNGTNLRINTIKY